MTHASRLPALALGAVLLSGCGMYRSYGSHDSTDLTLAAYETAVTEATDAVNRVRMDWQALEQISGSNPALRPVLDEYAHAMAEQDSLVKYHAQRLEAVKNPSLFKRIIGVGGYQYRQVAEAYGALATAQNLLNDRLSTLGATLAGRTTATTYLDGMVDDSRFYWTPPFYHRLVTPPPVDLLAKARAYRAPAAAAVAAPVAPAPSDSADVIEPMVQPNRPDSTHAAGEAH